MPPPRVCGDRILPMDLPMNRARTGRDGAIQVGTPCNVCPVQEAQSVIGQHGANGPAHSLKVAARVRIPYGLPRRSVQGPLRRASAVSARVADGVSMYGRQSAMKVSSDGGPLAGAARVPRP